MEAGIAKTRYIEIQVFTFVWLRPENSVLLRMLWISVQRESKQSYSF